MMPFPTISAVVTVHNCQRCQQDHDNLVFLPLANPADEWDWYATCPTTNQPIWMHFVEETGTNFEVQG